MRARILALALLALALPGFLCSTSYDPDDFAERSFFKGGYYGVLEGAGDQSGEYWLVVEEGGPEAGGALKGCVGRVWTVQAQEELYGEFAGSLLPDSETEGTVFLQLGFGVPIDMTLTRVDPPPDPAGPGDVVDLRSSNALFAGRVTRGVAEALESCGALAQLIAIRRRDDALGVGVRPSSEMARARASGMLLSGGLAGPPFAAPPLGEVEAALGVSHIDPTPRDSRLFGTWCQAGPEEICRTVKVKVGWGPLKVTVGTRRVCADVTDARVHLDYVDGPDAGWASGFGAMRIDGERNPFAVAGPVVRRGVARLGAQIPGRPHRAGTAALSGDGLVLSLYAAGERFVLRKDVCGNAPPRVALRSLSGSSLAWGETHCFEGVVTQDEDPVFPPERLRFDSSRDGPLGGGTPSPPRQAVLCTSDLSPGAHAITFAAVDGGGMRATASTPVEVTNRPPGLPVIVQPLEGDTVVATGELLFEGKAFDPDLGALAGGQLRWSARREGGEFEALGVGARLLTAFEEPGEYLVRLEATDGLLSRTASEPVTVLPFQGNVPPRVTIEAPRHGQVPGRLGGSFPAGELTFRGTVFDEEDGVGALALRWEATPVQPAGSPLPPVLDSTLATFRMPALGGNRTVYRVVFRATDRGGLVGRKAIEVLITP